MRKPVTRPWSSARCGRATMGFLLSLTLLAGCSGSPDASPSGDSDTSGLTIADTHVHAIERAGPTGGILLATHDGLWVQDGDQLRQVGPQLDLMGFSVVDATTYRASGHPGPAVDLAQPVGLIETSDAGQTWSALSREGESDFHLLDVNDTITVGFDGDVRSSADGKTWQTEQTPDGLIDLALRPSGQDVLATSTEGLLLSTDGGARWDAVPSAPPMVLLDWADQDTVVGISDTGAVHVSTDAGSTWQEREQLDSAIQAMSASRTTEGDLELLVAEKADYRAVTIT